MCDESKVMGVITYSSSLKKDCIVDIPVPLPDYVELDEYVAKAGAQGLLLRSYETDIRDEMRDLTLNELQRLEDERDDELIRNALSSEKISFRSIESNGKNSPQEPTIAFADKFSHIMHNASSSDLMMLIRKEIEMEKEMSQLMRARGWEVDQLTKECETMLGQVTSADIHPHQLSKLNEKLRQVHGSYGCQIEALAEEQRRNYREMVDSIYTGNSETSDTVNAPVEETTTHTLPAVSDSLDPAVDESFTIYIGAQLKSMHNARILTSPSLVQLCRTNQDHDLGSRLQMAMSMYGRSLTAIVMLVPRDPMWHTNSRSEFAILCEQSTELHFDSLAEQLKEVSASTRSANSWRADSASSNQEDNKGFGSDGLGPQRNDSSLSVGDVYCTKHSNLKQAQIVFHLVVDDQLQNTDISSRHPCLNGIRNVIRLTARLGVTSLFLPLLLIESPSESTTVAWCIRRAEMVYKCVKGYLMEVCGSSCGGSSSSAPHYNIHFVLPSGLSHSIYQQVTSMLPTIFHLVPGVSAAVS